MTAVKWILRIPEILFQFLIISQILMLAAKVMEVDILIKQPDCQRLSSLESGTQDEIDIPEKIDLFQLIEEEYQNQTIFDAEDKNTRKEDVILLLGNTGSGKSTLSQILAGDLTLVQAVATNDGNLVVVDEAELDQIGGPSTLSKTIRPERFTISLGSGQSSTLYDCPGFDDTRGPEMDIAANFLMQLKVVQNMGQVKMLFLVIHSAVKRGNDRHNFDLLANHVVKFMGQNDTLRKYKGSYALVVTKVPRFSDLGRTSSDEMVIDGTVGFLKGYAQDLKQKLRSEENEATKVELRSKISFVENLLEKNGERYPKISFTRIPEKCGPLSNSNVVLNDRKNLERLIDEDIEFTTGEGKDFGFTLKHETILFVQKTVTKLNQDIKRRVSQLAAEFLMWYNSTRFPNIDDQKIPPNLKQLSQQMIYDASAVQSFEEKKIQNFTEFEKGLQEIFGKLGFSLPAEFIDFLQNHRLYFDFFRRSIRGHAYRSQKNLEEPHLWLENLLAVFEKLKHFRTWYEFLYHVETRVAEYSFQKAKSTSFLAENPLGWLRYFKRDSTIQVGSHVEQASKNMGDAHLRILDEIMTVALQRSEVTCTEDTIRVKGHFVRLGDFVTPKGEISITTDESCDSELAKWVEIYASHKIFVDRNLQGVGRVWNVTFVAPIWSIVDSERKVNLSGADAGNVDPPMAPNAKNGTGSNGSNGKEGEPGGAGGSFFGATSGIEGDEFLRIILNGGRGGKGQNGGNGGSGGNGADVGEVKKKSWTEGWLYPTFTGTSTGKKGGRGGDGGRGGKGGVGGPRGHIELVSSVNRENAARVREKIAYETEVGPPGENAVGGSGGQGGRNGAGIECSQPTLLFIPVYDPSCTNITSYEFGDRGSDGQAPEDEPSWTWSIGTFSAKSAKDEDDGNGGAAETEICGKFDKEKTRIVQTFIKLFKEIGRKHFGTNKFIEFLESKLC